MFSTGCMWLNHILPTFVAGCPEHNCEQRIWPTRRKNPHKHSKNMQTPHNNGANPIYVNLITHLMFKVVFLLAIVTCFCWLYCLWTFQSPSLFFFFYFWKIKRICYFTGLQSHLCNHCGSPAPICDARNVGRLHTRAYTRRRETKPLNFPSSALWEFE